MFAGFYVFHIPVNVVSKHIFLEGAIKWREVGSKLKDLETSCLSNNCKSGCFVDAKYYLVLLKCFLSISNGVWMDTQAWIL